AGARAEQAGRVEHPDVEPGRCGSGQVREDHRWDDRRAERRQDHQLLDREDGPLVSQAIGCSLRVYSASFALSGWIAGRARTRFTYALISGVSGTSWNRVVHCRAIPHSTSVAVKFSP